MNIFKAGQNNYTPLKSPERVPSRPTGRPHRTISAKYVKVYFLTISSAGVLINWQLPVIHTYIRTRQTNEK